MNDYHKIPSLKKYVKTNANKDVKSLEKAGLDWTKAVSENRLNYEIEWLGIPIIQMPEDLVLLQELLFTLQPDFIIETGIAHGGGLVFYASLMEILGKGRVIGVDIEIREHNRKAIEAHPLAKRISLIEGSSTAPETIQKVNKLVPAGSETIVCLDSDHSRAHVLKELESYKPFIRTGGYFVVFDTVISRLAAPGNAEEKYLGNSPKEAIDEFLNNNRNFEIDKNYNRLYASSMPDGYLKRVK